MAIRDLMRDFVAKTVPNTTTTLRRAHEVLRQFAVPQSDDGPDMAGYRYQAERVQNQCDSLFFHDELGGQYHPQLYSAVCAAAQGVRQIYLADGGRRRFQQWFPARGHYIRNNWNAQNGTSGAAA